MIDLHLHLDGSLPFPVVNELMLLNYRSLSDEQKRLITQEEELRSRLRVDIDCDSLTTYLKAFDLPLLLLQTEASMKLAVKGLLENLKAEGLRYVEIRFAPQLHSSNYFLDAKMEHETAIVRAAVDASKEVSGIKCNFILCMMRGGLEVSNMRTLLIAKAFKNRGVVAVDLAGAEAQFPTSNYESYFKMAKELGLDFTIHAGEAGTYESKLDSLASAISFGAKRIGHGCALIKEPYLMNLCKERGIGIECCPTSNLQTKAIDDIDKHPIHTFLKSGLKVSVNTDNRTVSATNIGNEFEILSLFKEEKNKLIKNAIDMAFLSSEEKKEIFPEWIK